MKYALLLTVIFLTQSVSGQIQYPPEFAKEFYEAVSHKTDSLFTDYGYSAPGSAVVIAHHGNTIFRKGYGMADLENKIAITPETVFDLASISKMFTGYAIASLLHEKKISLHDDIRKFIPELPDYGFVITIDHLVHHTSGLKNWTEFIPIAGFSFDDVIGTKQVMFLSFRQKELNFIPGSKYEYCNTGYVLLAEIISRVTGLSLKEWCAINIFEPLAMTRTTVSEDHTQLISQKARSYFLGSDGEWHRSPESCSVPGSSSVHSSADDLARWLMFLDTPGDKKEIVNRMFERGKLNNGKEIDYGLGVFRKDFNSAMLIRHEGFWPSYSTFAFSFPENHLSIVVLNNSPLQSYKAIYEIARLFIPGNHQIRQMNASIPDTVSQEISSERAAELTGTYRGGPGWYLTVASNESALTAQPTADDPYPMVALSDSLFYVPEFKENITFQKDGALFMGKRLSKIEVQSSTKSDLQKAAGKYCSDELSTCYTINLAKSKLSLQHPHLGSFDLIPALNLDCKIVGAEKWFPSALELHISKGTIDYFTLGTYRFAKQ